MVFFSLRFRDFRICGRTLLNQNKSSIFGKKISNWIRIRDPWTETNLKKSEFVIYDLKQIHGFARQILGYMIPWYNLCQPYPWPNPLNFFDTQKHWYFSESSKCPTRIYCILKFDFQEFLCFYYLMNGKQTQNAWRLKTFLKTINLLSL